MIQPVTSKTTDKPTGSDTRKVVLHLGWMSALEGRLTPLFPAEEWREIRFDCDARAKPDILGRLDKFEGIADGSIDVVYAPQLIQRFPLPGVPLIIREMMRVLKDGGRAIITAPNAQIAATYLANNQPFQPLYETKLGPITPIDLLYGLRAGIVQGENHYQHRSGYTYEQMGLLLRDAGFTNIAVQRKAYEITAIGFRFPYDHPERVERISMGPPSEVENVKAPVIPQTTVEANTMPLQKGNSRPDEIDLPPGMWKPLGLKK
jgi:SAM-dependent methyltransferase